MMSDNHAFCRALLREVMKDVCKHTTPEQRKASWAWRYDDGDTIEFHGPDRFYWHGRGCCKWNARADGWTAWMEQQDIEGYCDQGGRL